MSNEINIIELKMYGVASVNCYLVKMDTGFILIDTGPSNKRAELEKEINNAGCDPGDIKLILITHGDSDHTGNAVYLRENYMTKIAMHKEDLEMVEKGDMSYNRNINFIAKVAFSLPFIKLSKSNRFKPDSYTEDGQDLSNYGFNAKIIHIPGHSKGSIGILTEDGNLFCGDLLENTKKPAINSIMDDKDSANNSIEKLRNFDIGVVYPGHGKPFSMDMLIKKEFKYG